MRKLSLMTLADFALGVATLRGYEYLTRFFTPPSNDGGFAAVNSLLVAKCKNVTLDEIREVDKELLAARYEAATTEEFGALAPLLGTTTEAVSRW